MKITKEEKPLWNFLNIFKNIFSKSGNRTLIFGEGNVLYLHTLEYAGLFVSKENDEKLLPDYDFKNDFYELKQLPNGVFVLDVADGVTKSERNLISSTINNTINNSKFKLELFKPDTYKVAKIVESTGIWFPDNDVKLLAFPEINVSQLDDSLVFQSFGIGEYGTVTAITYLVINHFDGKTPIQQKADFDYDVEIETAIEDELNELVVDIEDIEEFEDDFDPMAS